MVRHRQSPSRASLCWMLVLATLVAALALAPSASAAGWSGYFRFYERGEDPGGGLSVLTDSRDNYFFARHRVITDSGPSPDGRTWEQVVRWEGSYLNTQRTTDPNHCSPKLSVTSGKGRINGFTAHVEINNSDSGSTPDDFYAFMPARFVGGGASTFSTTHRYFNCKGELIGTDPDTRPPCYLSIAPLGAAPQGTNTTTVQGTLHGSDSPACAHDPAVRSLSYYLTRDPNPPGCGNGIDDDRDGLSDFQDPDCGAPPDPAEPVPPPHPTATEDTDDTPSPRDRTCAAPGVAGLVTDTADYAANTIGETWFPTIGRFLAPVGLVFGGVDLVCTVTDPDPRDPEGRPSDLFLHAACAGLSGTSLGLGIVGVANIWNPAGWIAAGSGVVTGLAAGVVCDRDPPDPNFKVIAKPRQPDPLIPPIPNNNRWGSEAVRKALTALNTNAARIVVTAEAMIHCIERAAGAKQAGNAHWQGRQRQCASDYAARLAQLYTNQKSIRTSVVSALRDWGAPNRTFTTEQLRARLPQIRSATNDLLEQVGADQRAIDFVNTHLRRAVYSVEGPGVIFKAISSDKVRDYLDDAAEGFRRIAQRYGQ